MATNSWPRSRYGFLSVHHQAATIHNCLYAFTPDSMSPPVTIFSNDISWKSLGCYLPLLPLFPLFYARSWRFIVLSSKLPSEPRKSVAVETGQLSASPRIEDTGSTPCIEDWLEDEADVTRGKLMSVSSGGSSCKS